MRVELPHVNRCCFCFPLRHGLLALAYMKLVVNLLLMLPTVFNLINFCKRGYGDVYVAIGCLLIIFLVIEISFNVLLVISAHLKNHVYLRVYYRYAVVMSIIQSIFILAYFGVAVDSLVEIPYWIALEFMLFTTCLWFLAIVLQIYFIILVRSELNKLQNGSKFEFVNHASEPVCKVEIVQK